MLDNARKKEIIKTAYKMLKFLGFMRFPIQLEALSHACTDRSALTLNTLPFGKLLSLMWPRSLILLKR